MKNKYVIIFITCLAVFFFFGAFKVNAQEVIIVEKPTASDIIYGEPLFESVLRGGSGNVPGTFSWKNQRNTFTVGKHTEVVVFTPNDSNYAPVETSVVFNVNKRRVYIKFEEEIRKLYDGTNKIELPNYIVGGIVDKTVYLKGTLNGTLNSVLIGENKVVLDGVELDGTNKENYYLDLEGFTASVHPKWIEKLIGVKNRIDIGGDYVPFDADIYVDKIENSSVKKENYKVKEVYDVYLMSGSKVIDVAGKVKVKIKLDASSLDYKRISLYNYYEGKFEKLDYKYENGFLIYKSNGLGELVIAQKELNFWWIYFLMGIVLLVVCVFCIVKSIKGREKFNKYKSLKRRKDYGNY